MASCSGSGTTPAVTVSVSGTGLDTGSQILLLDSASGATTLAEIAGGSFSADVDSGSYSIALLDDDNQAIALLIQDNASTFAFSDDTDLGTLTYDADALTLESSSTLTADTSIAAALRRLDDSTSTDVDLTDLMGVNMAATGDDSIDLDSLADSDNPDVDGDLVPNFLDNDNNGNGLYDSVEGIDLCRKDIYLAPGDSRGLDELEDIDCTVFDNLKLDSTVLYDSDGDVLPHTDEHLLALHVHVPASLVPYIVSVFAKNYPAYADGIVGTAAGGYSFAGTSAMTTYPSGAWSAVDTDSDGQGYDMPLATGPDGDDVFSLWVRPTTDPVPAIYHFRIVLTTGTTIELIAREQFIFNTPPKITSVTDGTTNSTLAYPRSDGDAGTFTNPIAIDSAATTLTLTGDRPLSDASSGAMEICGMSINAHIFYLDSAGSQMNVTAAFTTGVIDSGACVATTDISHAIDIATNLPTTYDGTAVAKYKIDFTVTGEGGDNSAETLYFTR
jgi:hypothetical protein